MAVEDFTTYTEVDEQGDVTVTPTKITIDTMARSADTYVYKDFGAGHFGDFEHLVKVTISAASGADATGAYWVLDNLVQDGNQRNIDNVGLNGYIYDINGVTPRIYIKDETNSNTDFYTATHGNTYYLTIERSGTTLTCKIYSDAARTILIDTLTITCNTTTYRYVYGMSGWGGSGINTITYDVENLDLQEATPPAAATKIGRLRGVSHWGG